MDEDKPAQVIPVPGQRRKRTKISQASAVKHAELYVSRRLPKYLKKLEELAMGVLVLTVRKDKEGSETATVYQTPPDRAALEYLIDRGMGKAPQRFEIEANQGPPQLPQAWAPDELPEGVIEGEARELDGQEQAKEIEAG